MQNRYLLATAALLLAAVEPLTAQGPKTAAPELPVTRIVLFNSGVGYFQREGQIDGSARVDLQFSIYSINDLLKSLVLQDLGGGHIGTIHYDSRNPIDLTLKSFAVDLTGEPSLGQLLKQVRGERIEVAVMPDRNVGGATTTLSGVIVGVEQKREAVGKDVVVTEQLNLLTADGVRGVPLSQMQRFRFLKPALEQDFRKALEVLASSRDTERKTVSLNFAGQGKRPVRVGYIMESPMWKPTYRLAMDKDKLFLQGWAIVENTTDEDWKDIRLGLVAGRPISFQMDLYEPLYVPRPVVEPEIFASLRPPTYQGNLGMNPFNPANFGGLAGGFGGMGGGIGLPPAPMEKKEEAKNGTLIGLTPANMKNVTGNLNLPITQGQQDRVKDVKEVIKRLEGINVSQGPGSAAITTDLGNYFQYLIEQPVTLPRQKSAMIPIVNQEVKGERVVIFNENVHSKYPLHGLRFKNATSLHLMQGPVTVFDEANYAGDCQIGDLKPNETRLLSYAIDLGTEVLRETKPFPSQLLAVKIDKGVIYPTHKHRRTASYTIKNRNEQARKMIIEHPHHRQEQASNWELIEPKKPTETARDVYRFELMAEPNKAVKLDVVEELQEVGRSLVADTSNDTLQLFLKASESSAKVKAALQKVLEMRAKTTESNRQVQREEQAVKVIEQDQARMRANMERVPPESEAYKRYLKKFDDQETDIEKRREQIVKLQETVETQIKALEEFIRTLNVD